MFPPNEEAIGEDKTLDAVHFVHPLNCVLDSPGKKGEDCPI